MISVQTIYHTEKGEKNWQTQTRIGHNPTTLDGSFLDANAGSVLGANQKEKTTIIVAPVFLP